MVSKCLGSTKISHNILLYLYTNVKHIVYFFMSKQWKSNNLTTDVIYASGQLQHLQDTASVDDFDNDFMSINIRN